MEWARTSAPAGPDQPATLYVKEEKTQPHQPHPLEARLREIETAAEQRVRDAHTRGRQEGEAAASQQFQTRVEQMAAVLQNIVDLRGRLRRESEADLVQLSIAIARRILRRELSVDPSALAGIIKACLDQLEGRLVQSIRLHPSIAEVIRSQMNPSTCLVADSNLKPGDIRVETDQGEMDAGIETQLSEIERGFADLLPQRRSS
jgi:flagellar assembly protein FliH